MQFKPISIYSLCDPRDGRVMYIGQTHNVTLRARQHQAVGKHWEPTPKKRHGLVGQWLHELYELGLEVLCPLIATVATEREGRQAESHYIQLYKPPLNMGMPGGNEAARESIRSKTPRNKAPRVKASRTKPPLKASHAKQRRQSFMLHAAERIREWEARQGK